MPPRRSTRNKSTSDSANNPPAPAKPHKRAISSTDPTMQPDKKKGKKANKVDEGLGEETDTTKKRGKKGKGRKTAMQCIAEDLKATSPVTLTSAEQNIIEDGTSVVPPKCIHDAVISLVPAPKSSGTTSGRIRHPEPHYIESTEDEDSNRNSNKENTNESDTGENNASKSNAGESNADESNAGESNVGESDAGEQSEQDTGNQNIGDSAHAEGTDNSKSQDLESICNNSRNIDHNQDNENGQKQSEEHTPDKNSGDTDTAEVQTSENTHDQRGENLHSEIDVHMTSPPRKGVIFNKSTEGTTCIQSNENDDVHMSSEIQQSKGNYISDIHMASPPRNEVYNLQGSSRVTGSYDCAIEDNEEFTWIQKEQYILHVLCIRYKKSYVIIRTYLADLGFESWG
ncbi:hypothetical protein BDQ17DRAFT_1331893 [Cyathus striatus]|nr:hypothetical protein BDQ17DRAFT_1331893 [Cyathus striatus]